MRPPETGVQSVDVEETSAYVGAPPLMLIPIDDAEGETNFALRFCDALAAVRFGMKTLALPAAVPATVEGALTPGGVLVLPPPPHAAVPIASSVIAAVHRIAFFTGVAIRHPAGLRWASRAL